jgi:hypothetical protein
VPPPVEFIVVQDMRAVQEFVRNLHRHAQQPSAVVEQFCVDQRHLFSKKPNDGQ